MADPSNLQTKILLLFKKEKKLILDFAQIMNFGDEFRFRRPKGGYLLLFRQVKALEKASRPALAQQSTAPSSGDPWQPLFPLK